MARLATARTVAKRRRLSSPCFATARAPAEADRTGVRARCTSDNLCWLISVLWWEFRPIAEKLQR